MRVETFLARFEGVKKEARGGWSARCPAHKDKRQSLSINEGDKGIILKCHAGCGTADVLDALGLKLRDLFPEKPQRASFAPTPSPSKEGNGKARIVATYDYTDEDNALLFQVVRFEPKDFRQRRPDADKPGGWNWSTAGCRKVLWRLPGLVAGPEHDDTALFLCEGEKDAMALAAVGAAATCNPGGAGKWLGEYTVSLAKWRRIIIVADKDEPGRKHARQVAGALAQPGRTVKIIEVPGTGKDAADFLATGGTVDLLLALADKTTALQASEATGGPTPGPSKEGNPAPTLPPCVFDTGRQRFFIPAGMEWIPVNDTRAAVYFKKCGFSEYVKDSFMVSVLESALQRVVIERNVLFAGQLAGYWSGPITVTGQRMLITRGPSLITPKAGDWSTLRTLLEEMLLWPDAPEPHLVTAQWDLFCGWVWSAFESLRDKTFRPGLVLTLCGKMGGGKSVLQGLLTLLLGGRSANPYAFLTGRTDFNLDLIGAEHLTVDDDASERDFKSRQSLGQKIKKLAVADTVSLHGKGRDAITVKTFCRISICINDDPQDLMVLPPMEDSVREKFLLMKIRPATFPAMTEPHEFATFKVKLVSELPAFLHYLQSVFKVPAAIRSARYGVKNWQHPELLLDLEALHPWQRLVELIDHCEPWHPKDEKGGRGVGEVWEGTVQDLEDALRERAQSRAVSVLRGAQGTGMDLHCAMQRLPRRIAKRQSMGRTIWILRKGGAAVVEL